MAEVYLVDGTFELFRCFHGTPRHTNADGEEVGAVRGLLHTLLSLLKGLKPRIDDAAPGYVAVAFDPLPAGRGGSAKDPGTLIRRQSALALDAVRALGIRLWPMVRFQADDALATGAHALRVDATASRVVICTTDTDLFQCIRGTDVVVLDRIRGTVTDETDFRARYAIAPWQFTDYLALVGAPAKGIPGVPGWGPKNAARMLAAHGRIEDFPPGREEWQAVRRGGHLAAEFADRRDEALLVKRLATLRNDLPLDCSLPALAWRGLDDVRLRRVVAAAEANDLWERIERWST
ncbi:MAG: flap endonuclease [Gammaproteobacteria bacterium]|nr:flap endonuclease [Gammaproteobacteria bacterium]MYF29626.1 flap endonuclease [Gammaproteobacteria bacterium]MYK44618.1 flap endonuclease [Gammaproteobacteria bacterium]